MEFDLSHTEDNTASNVVKSDRRYDQDSTEAYYMGSNPKGYLLIIKYQSLPRYYLDSERDARRVQNLFLMLGYIVMQKRVWSSKDFMEVVEEFRKLLHNCTKVDSIFIYVITCDEDVIYNPHLIEIEGGKIQVATLLNMFANDVLFNGKPKVIFFQSTGCREVPEEHFHLLWSSSFLPPPEDCLVVSYLEPGIYNSKSFLRSICDVIRRNAHNTDLEEMTILVEKFVRDKNKSSRRFSYFRVYSTSFKKLYFNPGLYDQTPYECQTGDNTAINVVKPDGRYDQDSTEVYLMGANPKGYLLIIQYSSLAWNQSDSDRDVKRLQEVFSAVGYIVLQKPVLRSKDFMKGVEEFRQFLRTWITKVDSVLIYIMTYQTSSHYPKSLVTDREKTPIEIVMRVFANDEFFNGKPKVVFVHSTGTPDLVKVEHFDCLPSESSPALPEDCLVVSSYQRDNYSDVEVSICVDAICKEITETADNTDLETMMRNVEKNFGDKLINDKLELHFKVYRTSFKKLYFNPSLDDEPPSCSQSDTVDSMQGTANDSIPNNPLPDETVRKEDCEDPEDVLQPFEIIVRKSEQRLDKDKSMTYKMGSRPKGYALVISNEKFKYNAHEERIGGDKDRDNLNKLLTGLGYEVTVKHNLTKAEMEGAIISFRNSPKHEKVDSTIVFILTHGELNKANDIRLITSDNLHVYSEWIIEQFYGRDCPDLIGKPKLFFFQCCRGTDMEEVVKVVSKVQTDGVTKEPIPNKADILIVHACAPGSVALRSPISGSWFVHFLCKVFAEKAHDKEVIDMLKHTSRQIKMCVDPGMGTQVMCYSSQGFDKSLYFNPGLYDD